MKLNPLTCIDFYKADHRRQYPEGTTLVYSNLTPRYDHHISIPRNIWTGKVVNFGLQYFVKEFLIKTWNEEFFEQPKEKVVAAYRRRMDTSLGAGAISTEHIEALHDLGYLPICIKALPEGTLSPVKVPCLVIYNTKPEFFWLTNYLETVMSSYLWKPMTTATIALHYRLMLDNAAKKSGCPSDFVPWQGHDFSFRGMSSPSDAALAGAGHLLSFYGTDSVVAIDLLEQYYNADAEKEIVGGSVPATEHSVMCMGTKDDELLTFHRIINKLYPKGLVSIVSDTWDFWKVLTEIAVELKEAILAREGKVVFRPDSGDPVKVICGDPEAKAGTPEHKGAASLLAEVFGTQDNDLGYAQLSPSVGLIYGDSITPQRCQAILEGLLRKGICTSCIVFGIGSYTYQYITRDSLGFAVKSTYGIVDGEKRNIYKDPVTDDGGKRSAKGLIAVKKDSNGELYLDDEQSDLSPAGCQLRKVFEDGKLLIDDSLSLIRSRLEKQRANT